MTEAVNSQQQPNLPPLPEPEPPSPRRTSATRPPSPWRWASAGCSSGCCGRGLAPRVQYVSNGEAVFLRDTESEARIGADGTFFLLALGLGLLTAVAVFLWRRRGGVSLVIGLAVGACFASLVGWRLGLWLSPGGDVPAAAAKAGKGVPFDAPLQLLAYGVLLVWPMAAVAAHLALTALWGPRDAGPEADWPLEGTYPPPHVHAAPEPPQP
ncbi:hypothetical protein [Streptomyces sp. C]|uniref:hypothetical protein n=1 Tax=Streptomyces sp. C TaxID=253839 RepID=UPI0001B5821B|nr:hypothetical protein [Streptomyces sp. C]EFL14636.1 conserved hypothetical protein [Streptomyces sp. C]